MIIEEMDEYYDALEDIRSSGVCNMYGGDKALRLLYTELSRKEAKDILRGWIDKVKTEGEFIDNL